MEDANPSSQTKLEFQGNSSAVELEQSGVISGSKFVVNPKVLGYNTMAFVGVYTRKAARNLEAVKELKKEVLECHYTRNWSILIKII
jgi:Lrp/AsnC family transcriptional regulator for asnA, asnC and gidA